ncbi:MAG: cysteine desulfurase family protein, partial [Patescibacteria group bacterium]
MPIKKFIYLDYASTTPTAPEVIKAMAPFWSEKFGNPSNLYQAGRVAFDALESARASIAKSIACNPSEIIFTSGGTESCNLAIRGLAKNFGTGHIITTNIEHHAVKNTIEDLARDGFGVSVAPVEKSGVVDLDKLKSLVKDDTFLISVMWVNNEIGTIQPIEKIGRFIRDENVRRISRGLKKIYFHTDACQAMTYLTMNLAKNFLDLMSFNGSKIYGPKGTGGLFVRQKTPLMPIMSGGEQELGIRPGTQCVALAVGLAKAMELVSQKRESENIRLKRLRDWLWNQLAHKYPEIEFNGDRQKRIPSNLNFSVPSVEGEALTLMLDEEGVMASTGSACASSDLKPSFVLTAISRSPELAHSSIRVTMGKFTTQSDLKYFLASFDKVYKKLKKISAK